MKKDLDKIARFCRRHNFDSSIKEKLVVTNKNALLFIAYPDSRYVEVYPTSNEVKQTERYEGLMDLFRNLDYSFLAPHI